ncbi:MAG: hypothetical protein N4A57_14735 [Anaeromicrobium sp.]|jgi:hypothetical protein|uniref:hypothetical protein n=1 Tax=Anaeromicrobium sp. TaxID=1929132 RepID=UPI0025E82B1C|nr:hypothetical protein [Anaeromicrobium sp.]MCT4595502.1 hypothetical protein [Anaeromicrobium sp.]
MYYDDYNYEAEYDNYNPYEADYMNYDNSDYVEEMDYHRDPYCKEKRCLYRVTLRNGYRFRFDFVSLERGYYKGYMKDSRKRWKPVKIKKERVVRMTRVK